MRASAAARDLRGFAFETGSRKFGALRSGVLLDLFPRTLAPVGAPSTECDEKGVAHAAPMTADGLGLHRSCAWQFRGAAVRLTRYASCFVSIGGGPMLVFCKTAERAGLASGKHSRPYGTWSLVPRDVNQCQMPARRGPREAARLATFLEHVAWLIFDARAANFKCARRIRDGRSRALKGNIAPPDRAEQRRAASKAALAVA